MRSPFDVCLMMLPAAALVILAGPAPPAAADLVIQVDMDAQEYFLSGTATGTPPQHSHPSFPNNGFLSWNNGQTTSIGTVHDFLPTAAYIVSGNTILGTSGSIHAAGNVNATINFASQNVTTLTGNESMRFNYSGWAGGVINQLESKALSGEVLPIVGQDPAFEMTFAVAQAAVPEPASLALCALGGLGLIVSRRRKRANSKES